MDIRQFVNDYYVEYTNEDEYSIAYDANETYDGDIVARLYEVQKQHEDTVLSYLMLHPKVDPIDNEVNVFVQRGYRFKGNEYLVAIRHYDTCEVIWCVNLDLLDKLNDELEVHNE